MGFASVNELHITVAVICALIVFGTVAVYPRLGFFAIPITVPWGAELAIANVGLTDVIVVALIAAWLVRVTYFQRVDIDVNPWVLATALLLFVMLLSISQATSLSVSGREIVKWSEVLLIAVMAPVFLTDDRDLWTVVFAVAVAGVSESLLGMGQFLFHIGPHNFQIYGHFMRAYGTFGQPNPLAGFLEITLMITLAAAWVGRKAWLWPAGMVIAAGAAVTFSRAGWMAAMIGIGLMACVGCRQFRPLAFLVGAGALAVAALAALSVLPTGPFVHAASSFGVTGIDFRHHTKADFSEIERAAHWVAGLRMFAANPILGVGIGNYPVVYGTYFVAGFPKALGHAHNYFINIAAETGILGALAYALFLLTGFWMSISSALRAYISSSSRVLGLGMAGVWACIAVHNLFDVLFVHQMATLIGLLMGVLWASTGHNTGRNRPSAESTAGLRNFNS